jgi:hypothetical protein
MVKDKTYKCKYCGKVVREKAVTDTMKDLGLCVKCNTKRVIHLEAGE